MFFNTQIQDPICELHFAIDETIGGKKGYTYEKLFQDIFDRATSGHLPKEIAIYEFDAIYNNQEKVQFPPLEESRQKLIDLPPFPLIPAHAKNFIKTVYFLGTHNAPTNQNSPWCSFDVTKQRLEDILNFYIARSQPNNEKQIKHPLHPSETHKFFLDLFEMIPNFLEFNISLPDLYVKEFLDQCLRSDEEKQSFFKEFTSMVDTIRKRPPDGLLESHCTIIITQCLKSIASAPSNLYSESDYAIFAYGTESYFPVAKNILPEVKLQQNVIQFFICNAFKYLQCLNQQENLEGSRKKFKAEEIEPIRSKLNELSKENEVSSNETLDQLKVQLTEKLVDFNTLKVETNLLNILFSSLIICPLQDDIFIQLADVFSDNLVRALEIKIIEIDDLGNILKPVAKYNDSSIRPQLKHLFIIVGNKLKDSFDEMTLNLVIERFGVVLTTYFQSSNRYNNCGIAEEVKSLKEHLFGQSSFPVSNISNSSLEIDEDEPAIVRKSSSGSWNSQVEPKKIPLKNRLTSFLFKKNSSRKKSS